MKVNYDIVNQRRKDIMIKIQEDGKSDVNDLARYFNVSKATIRRDLTSLEESGLISRLYGGATTKPTEEATSDLTSHKDLILHSIAKNASQFVNDGDTIFINTSYTALLLIEYIKNKRVTIITNNARSVQVKHDPLVSIHLTGGELRFPKEALVGDFALNNLMKVKANKCFLGCNGINATEGISTAVLHEAAINECMINRTNGEIFILADNSKIGEINSFNSSPIDKIDYLITDNLANTSALMELSAANIKIIKVDPNA